MLIAERPRITVYDLYWSTTLFCFNYMYKGETISKIQCIENEDYYLIVTLDANVYRVTAETIVYKIGSSLSDFINRYENKIR